MKRIIKLSLTVICLIALAGYAHAAVNTATFGDMNSSNVYRMTADSDGTITFASDTSLKIPYKSITSTTIDQWLVTTDSGRWIVDYGASGMTITDGTIVASGHKIHLPPASVGMTYSISTGVKEYITVDCDTTDVIQYSISGVGLNAGDSLKSSGNAGDAIQVYCPTAGKWIIWGIMGSWTDNGAS